MQAWAKVDSRRRGLLAGKDERRMDLELPSRGATEVPPPPWFLNTLFRPSLAPTALIAPFDHEQIGFAPARAPGVDPGVFARSARVVAPSGRQG